MFQFTRLPSTCPMYSGRRHARITTRGFPHSEIPGSKVGQHLPRAFRSRPRPSSALGAKASTVCPSSLDHEEHRDLPLWSFQGARGASRPPQSAVAEARSLKTQQRGCTRRGRHYFQASSDHPDELERLLIDESERLPGVRAPVFPRKEVIQPQLPLRLPCYDFTPVTNPTFDGSLPCGLGHRLRVLPASVV